MTQPKWKKKLNMWRFPFQGDRIPCPYCTETFPSNLSLCRHALGKHNWYRSEQFEKDIRTRIKNYQDQANDQETSDMWKEIYAQVAFELGKGLGQ